MDTRRCYGGLEVASETGHEEAERPKSATNLRGPLIGVAIIGLVLGLVALNLSTRTDAEPHFEPDQDALPTRTLPNVLRGSEDAGSEGEAAVPTEGSEPDEDGVEEPGVDGCDHPFIPARAGQWRRYRWRATSEEDVATLRVSASRTRTRPDGEREILWAIRTGAEGDEDPIASINLRTRCRPGDEAEEPWFGILERVGMRVRMTRRTAIWRWPAALSPGVSFRGTATFDAEHTDARVPEGVEGEPMLTVTRTHIVDRREEVEVAAGTFDAWRVAYEEHHSFGTHGETGEAVVWIAEDVGLVKSRAENSQGVVQTLELVAFGD